MMETAVITVTKLFVASAVYPGMLLKMLEFITPASHNQGPTIPKVTETRRNRQLERHTRIDFLKEMS